MAENSRFWATNGTGDGVGSGFTATHWQNLITKLFEGGEQINGAVLRGVDNQLACSGTATPISVATGAAIGYGHFYESDTVVTLAVTTPTIGTTGGHVVLETNWTTQTVRLKMYKSSDGVSTPPALTQNAGTLWQTRLCTFTITTGGVITITDARSYAHFSTEVTTAMIKDQAVTAAKLAVGAALSNLGFSPFHTGNDGAGSGLDADLLDGQDGAFFLAFANFTGQAALAQIANDAIDDTKAGNRVPQFYRRQGGSASDWFAQGNTSQTPTAVRMQAGVKRWTGAAAAVGNVGITFPVAFSNNSIVFAVALSKEDINVSTDNSGGNTTTGFAILWKAISGVAGYTSIDFAWLAIGPE